MGEDIQKNEIDQDIDIKKQNRKFIFKFVMFTIVLMALTALSIYLTILSFNKIEAETSKEDKSGTTENTKDNEEKKVAEDEKYKLKSYSETYSTNAIEINTYKDVNGNVTKVDYGTSSATRDNSSVEFLEINGLKNSIVEDKINKLLKDEAYNLKIDNNTNVYCFTYGNFSNVLSVGIYAYSSVTKDSKNKYINLDLTTGNEIKFEDVFVSSAPLNSILAEGLYKRLAWNVDVDFWMSEEEYERNSNMDYRDASEYEDKFFLIVNKYNQIKDNIEFYLTPNRVVVADILDESMLGDAEDYYANLSIDFLDCFYELAIYKRYLTDESIYENDELAVKNIIVLTTMDSYYDIISYGKVSDNVFVEDILINMAKESNDKIIKYLENKSKEQIDKLKSETGKNEGVFFQTEYYIYYDTRNEYYSVSYYTSKATCSANYFKNEAFRDYISVKNRPRADVSLNMFSSYMKDDYPELSITTSEYANYYFDKDGNYLGDNRDELQ